MWPWQADDTCEVAVNLYSSSGMCCSPGSLWRWRCPALAGNAEELARVVAHCTGTQTTHGRFSFCMALHRISERHRGAIVHELIRDETVRLDSRGQCGFTVQGAAA